MPKEKDITTTPPKKVNGHPTTTALKRTASEGHAQTPSKDERNGGAPRKPLDHSIQSRVENFRAEYQRYIKKIPRHAPIRYPIFCVHLVLMFFDVCLQVCGVGEAFEI